MRRKLFILFFLFSTSVMVQAQRNKEALLQVIRTAKEDTKKVKALLEIGDLYSNSEPATGKAYFIQALEISVRSDYKYGILKAYTLCGGV